MNHRTATDDLALAARYAAFEELNTMMDVVYLEAFTTAELLAMLTVMRPVLDRIQEGKTQPAPVLELVRRRTRKRGS